MFWFLRTFSGVSLCLIGFVCAYLGAQQSVASGGKDLGCLSIFTL